MIDRDDITGLILAGGRGSRMGGVDKGLQAHLGIPLAMHALLRLSPQVGEVMINANRNQEAYVYRLTVEHRPGGTQANGSQHVCRPEPGFLRRLAHPRHNGLCACVSAHRDEVVLRD